MFTIKEAKVNDYSTIEAFVRDLYSSMAHIVPTIHKIPDDKSSCLSESMFHDDISSKRQAYFIAIHNPTNSNIGFLSVGRRSSPKNPFFRETSSANIDEIYVVPKYRKCGVARCLVEAAFEWAKKERLETVKTGVYVRNEDGYSFWQKMGFNPYKALVERHLLEETTD